MANDMFVFFITGGALSASVMLDPQGNVCPAWVIYQYAAEYCFCAFRMNCEECKGLLSSFMDNELDRERSAAVMDHLALCPPCSDVCSNLTMLMNASAEATPEELLPNDSKKIWIKIQNVIETEAKPVMPPEPPPAAWRFSFLRLGAAMLVIAVISSVLTIFALRRYQAPPGDEFFVRTATTQTAFDKLLSKVGLVDTPQQARERRIREQQAAIDYWNTRVQARRVQWDARTREAFDRNLGVIDESLHEYSMILAQDPEDELSGEMFDSVLHEKMNLLRDFADL